MPLPDELRRGLDSAGRRHGEPDPATGWAACSSAGLFLRDFVPDGLRWVHLDIAGPAWNNTEAHGYTPQGGTGVRRTHPRPARGADGRRRARQLIAQRSRSDCNLSCFRGVLISERAA